MAVKSGNLTRCPCLGSYVVAHHEQAMPEALGAQCKRKTGAILTHPAQPDAKKRNFGKS
jgi:hypothetical protein